jgi:hypothetical protein
MKIIIFNFQLDGFLVDVKFRTLDIDHCCSCLFISRSGPARRLERILRIMMNYIFVVSNPEPDPQGRYMVTRRLTYEQQLFVKRIWIDSHYSTADLKHEWHQDNAGNLHEVQNLIYDPITGEEMLTRMSMYRMVLDNLSPITSFRADITCHCGGEMAKVLQCFRYEVIMLDSGDRVLVPEPAFRTFSAVTLEFDNKYWLTGENPNINRLDKNLARRIQGAPCELCHLQMTVSNIQVPETSWELVVEVLVEIKLDAGLHELTPVMLHAGSAFEIRWVSLMSHYSHFVSLHLVNQVWYKFDDMDGHTSNRPCPVNRLDIDHFRANRREYTMERVFYTRMADRDPHRCLRLANEFDERNP